MPEDNGDDVVPRPQRETRQPATRKSMKPDSPVPANFNTLREQANKGDLQAQAQLKAWLDANPSVWNEIGDLARHAQKEFLRLVTKGDFLFSESIRRRSDQMRRELLGPFPSALEILCTERIVASWLHVQYIEGQIALSDGEIPRARFWLQRQLQANRLYHAAVKGLMLVRELLPREGPPEALAASGPTSAKLNGKGRLALHANGDGHALMQSSSSPANRINGHTKNGKRQELATG